MITPDPARRLPQARRSPLSYLLLPLLLVAAGGAVYAYLYTQESKVEPVAFTVITTEDPAGALNEGEPRRVYQSSSLVPVNYKTEFADVREIDAKFASLFGAK